MLVLRALHAAPAVVAERSRRRAAGRLGAHRRGAALELLEIATRLGRRTVDVRRALRASPAHAARRGRRTVAVHRAARAPAGDDIADRLARSAVAALPALDAHAGRRLAELGPAIAALGVRRALRMAFVIAGPACRRARSAVGVVPTLLAAARDAERIARPAIGIADALHAAEVRVAFPSAARALRAREVPAATDQAGVLAVAPARDDYDCDNRQGNHPVLHGSYGSVPRR